MVLLESEYLLIEQELNPILFDELDLDSKARIAIGDYKIKIRINGFWYSVIPFFNLIRLNKETVDDKYHFIYIQVNFDSGEYYIGKVNRTKWKEIRRYQGSGKRFVNAYRKHKDGFVRYYIYACKSAEESERVEARIVNEDLLKDPMCLNLVKGGAGTNKHVSSIERNAKISAYMKSHPEQYRNMIETAKRIYQSEDKTALIARNNHIKETMNSDKYKKMTSDRIKNWIKNNPEQYKQSRENNKKSIQSEVSKKKLSDSLKRWRDDNPEQYKINKRKALEACHTPEAEKKRSESLKKFYKEHPEVLQENLKKALNKWRRPVAMLDLQTNETIREFESIQEASLWLIDNGYAKNTNCKSSISAVCSHKPCRTGYGYRKKAYGYGWMYIEKKH